MTTQVKSYMYETLFTVTTRICFNIKLLENISYTFLFTQQSYFLLFKAYLNSDKGEDTGPFAMTATVYN